MTPPLKPSAVTSASGEAERVPVGAEVNEAIKSPPLDFAFHVNGTAAPQGSKKHVGKGVLVEMSKNLPAWRKAVKDAAMTAWMRPALDAPVSVQVTFRITKPKSTKFRDYPAGPADLDKLLRSTGDALEQAGVLTNDSRIVHWDAMKVWGEPGATIAITEMRTQ